MEFAGNITEYTEKAEKQAARSRELRSRGFAHSCRRKPQSFRGKMVPLISADSAVFRTFPRLPSAASTTVFTELLLSGLITELDRKF